MLSPSTSNYSNIHINIYKLYVKMKMIVKNFNGSISKKLFISMVMLSIIGTGLLYTLDAGLWLYALIFFGIANYFFSASNVLYDKILVQITSPDLFSKISGYGYAWGYFGGGLLFLVNALMSLYPEMFGLESQADAIRWSFITVSVCLLYTSPSPRD